MMVVTVSNSQENCMTSSFRWLTKSRTRGRPADHSRRRRRSVGVFALGGSECVLQHAELRVAKEPSELRAAAFVRAASFYEFNSERSEFAQEAHRRMKADAEWQALEDKLNQSAPGWQDTTVVPLLMLVPNTPHDASVQAVLESMADLSAQLPPAKPGDAAMVPIATLDLNIGVSLPAEELLGSLPQDNAKDQRCYLSNVCVASGARRQGIAKRLVSAAESIGKERGVRHMYVHVVHDNAAARALYSACGFDVEREETADAARKRQHGRRLLLGKSV